MHYEKNSKSIETFLIKINKNIHIRLFRPARAFLVRKVVDAERDNTFHFSAVKTVNGALEILTRLPGGGRPAGLTWLQGVIQLLCRQEAVKMSKKLKAAGMGDEKQKRKEENSGPAPKKGPGPRGTVCRDQ